MWPKSWTRGEIFLYTTIDPRTKMQFNMKSFFAAWIDRKSLTSLHRSNKEVNPWASSSYERPQRIVRHQDNLTVGGKFYSHSEGRSYGNFSNQQKVERIQKQSNVSHISLGDSSSLNSSMYKKEYIPRNRGPCPAALLEAKKVPFKHTRDTQKHKFYMPLISN